MKIQFIFFPYFVFYNLQKKKATILCQSKLRITKYFPHSMSLFISSPFLSVFLSHYPCYEYIYKGKSETSAFVFLVYPCVCLIRHGTQSSLPALIYLACRPTTSVPRCSCSGYSRSISISLVRLTLTERNESVQHCPLPRDASKNETGREVSFRLFFFRSHCTLRKICRILPKSEGWYESRGIGCYLLFLFLENWIYLFVLSVGFDQSIYKKIKYKMEIQILRLI